MKELKDFINTYAKENYLPVEVVAEIFEKSLKIAASRYFPSHIVNSLHYDREQGIIINDKGEEIDIKSKFGLGGIKSLKDHFFKQIKEICVEREVANIMKSHSKLIIGKVISVDKSKVFLSYKTLELIMPKEEQLLSEEYKIGELYKVVVIKVNKIKNEYEVIVSRRSDSLLLELLMLEVPEIREKKISIVSLAREPGYRSKIAVKTNIPGIDVVGICMGFRNIRISNVSRELSGEKIDIIEWKSDIKELIKSALKPAEVLNVTLIESEKKALVEIPEKDVGVCLGKNGQNIRLASRLCGWYIEVKK